MEVFINWRNKDSGETGYVKGVNLKEGHIDATWSKEEVKVYKSEGVARGILTKLERMGVEQQNVFSIVPAYALNLEK